MKIVIIFITSMPLYKFTIKLRDVQKPIIGIREIASYDIDVVYRTYKLKAEEKYSSYKVADFEVIMISKLSQEGKEYLSQKRKPLSE